MCGGDNEEEWKNEENNSGKKIIPAAKARKARKRNGTVGQKDKRDVPVSFSIPAPANVCASLN
jgi:hypothetical protein